MFDEPNEDPSQRPIDPLVRASGKSDEFRMHAEFAAVFEGTRKFDAQIIAGLDPEIARDVQRAIGKLEKAKLPETPIIAPASAADAERLLLLPLTSALSTNDYHVHRRPGEVMIVRWLAAEQVDAFYLRLQAHFNAAMNQFREDERQSNEWKRDPKTLAYIDALDKIEVDMAARYLREPLLQLGKLSAKAAEGAKPDATQNVFVLSTQAADELDILHLCVYVMNVAPADVVGRASAPPSEDPTESERAWFFKLFSLRGVIDRVERMVFFTYLQKIDESDSEEDPW